MKKIYLLLVLFSTNAVGAVFAPGQNVLFAPAASTTAPIIKPVAQVVKPSITLPLKASLLVGVFGDTQAGFTCNFNVSFAGQTLNFYGTNPTMAYIKGADVVAECRNWFIHTFPMIPVE